MSHVLKLGLGLFFMCTVTSVVILWCIFYNYRIVYTFMKHLVHIEILTQGYQRNDYCYVLL